MLATRGPSREQGSLLQENYGHQLKREPASGEEQAEAGRISDDTGHDRAKDALAEEGYLGTHEGDGERHQPHLAHALSPSLNISKIAHYRPDDYRLG